MTNTSNYHDDDIKFMNSLKKHNKYEEAKDLIDGLIYHNIEYKIFVDIENKDDCCIYVGYSTIHKGFKNSLWRVELVDGNKCDIFNVNNNADILLLFITS